MQRRESNLIPNTWIPSHTSTIFYLTKIVCREIEHIDKRIDFIFNKKGIQNLLDGSHILVAIKYPKTHNHCELIHILLQKLHINLCINTHNFSN